MNLIYDQCTSSFKWNRELNEFPTKRLNFTKKYLSFFSLCVHTDLILIPVLKALCIVLHVGVILLAHLASIFASDCSWVHSYFDVYVSSSLTPKRHLQKN